MSHASQSPFPLAHNIHAAEETTPAGRHGSASTVPSYALPWVDRGRRNPT